MKHSLIIILAFLFINIGAQSDSSNGNMVSKRGFTILPEAGDISVGIDASSLFSYVGGFFSNAGGGSPTFDYPQTFIGGPNVFIKYMLDANTAARIRFGHSSSVYNDKYAVLQSLTNPDPLNPSYVTDIVTSRNHSAVIAAGIQKYRGKGRLKGIYGAEVGAGFYQNSYSYNYGNDITQNFTTPATYNNFYVNGGQRTISDNYGKQFYFGVRPYIGVEYFFAPKMSLSGEFGYQIYYSTMTNRTQTREYWDGSVGGVRTVTDKMTYNGHGSFSAGIDNLAGFITLQFYF